MDATGPMVKVKPRFTAPLKSSLQESGGERGEEREEQHTAAGPSSKKKGKKRPGKEGEDDGRKDEVKKRRQDEEEEDQSHVAKNVRTSGGKRKKGKEEKAEKRLIEEQEQAGDISTDAEQADMMPREEEEERPESRGGQEEDEEEEEDEEDGTNQSWVQCCKPECGKWRRLLPQTDPSELPRNWNCTMNIDPVFSSCLVSEEEFDESEDYTIFSNLVPGSLVWAQQRGYPWWPALIEDDPDDPKTDSYRQFKSGTDNRPCRYHVTYLGEPVSRAWVPQRKVKPYMDLTEHHVMMSASQGYKLKLKESIVMATEVQKIPMMRRLEEFGFFSRRYVGEDMSDSESEVDSELQEAMEIVLEKRKKAHFRKKKHPNKDKVKVEHKQHKQEKREKKRAVESTPTSGVKKEKKKMRVTKKPAPYKGPPMMEWRGGDDQEESEGGKDGMETDFSSDEL